MSARGIGTGLIEVTGDVATAVSGPIAPLTYIAKEALKWGYGHLMDEYEMRKREELRREMYKTGAWYKNDNYDMDSAMVGGPSDRGVPLAPDVDPEAWTTDGRKRWEGKRYSPDGKEVVYKNGISYYGERIVPTHLTRPSGTFGWREHYEPQRPTLVVDYSKGDVNLHPPQTTNPNATMPPAGGFSKRRR
jgi:hypothetical protein